MPFDNKTIYKLASDAASRVQEENDYINADAYAAEEEFALTVQEAYALLEATEPNWANLEQPTPTSIVIKKLRDYIETEHEIVFDHEATRNVFARYLKAANLDTTDAYSKQLNLWQDQSLSEL